jgi:NADPH-dependent curcumin reductase CurA
MTAQEKFYKCPDFGISYAHYTATLAMTGLSAWGGLTDCGQPRPGDVVVVSGAAGGVGSIVVQIARILGCRVIGIAGGPEKCAWLKDLGVEATIDYKSQNVPDQIKRLCPNGIDIYFDNVGGEILEAALDNLAMGARIVLCGSISEYTRDRAAGPANYTNLRRVNGSMKGFFVYNYLDRFSQSMETLGGWIRDGQLNPKLDIADGIEQMPNALMRLYDGANYGVQCCRVRRGPYDDA